MRERLSVECCILLLQMGILQKVFFITCSVPQCVCLFVDYCEIQVWSINRLLIDPSFRQQSGVDCGQQTEAYDLLLTDTSKKAKYLLNTALNPLVQNCKVITYILTINSFIGLQ